MDQVLVRPLSETEIERFELIEKSEGEEYRLHTQSGRAASVEAGKWILVPNAQLS
ncbi:hypothetical protein M9194_10455 [Vibrio sp. S4M6]|uniref:hypothetical protein n=1 Tax=Vibrio sinus TaxID=2946865 RepID=UPI002029DB47|nr:hypothetical protein [Vibrio sinus]MCL9781848.1 hypothetical protein [Vibrio sinus]